MSKCGSNYKIANCTLEGGLIGAVSWSNTELFYLTSLFVLHFFFNNNSKDSSEILIFLFPRHPRG